MFRFLSILFLLLLARSASSQDITPPDTPVLDSVSLLNPLDLNSGKVIVSWFPCDSADVANYVIYRSISMVWQQIAVVPSPATSYIDVTAAGNFQVEAYRIAATDEVNNISPMTLNAQYHNTIHPFPYQDSANCQMAIKLEWGKYVYWSEGVNEYNIYFSENYGPWTLLSTVTGNTSVFYHQTINDNTSYCYIVRAVSNSGRTSTSSQTCFFTNLPDYPHFINADYASVVSDNRIEVSFTLDTLFNVKKNYKLLRAEGSDGTFIQIANYNNYTSLNLIYYDNVDATKSWYYKLVAVDLCGNFVVQSNIL